MSDFKTFISYRRSDSISEARRVYEFLVEHYGDRNVFIDIDSMRAGINFELQLHGAITQCDIVLVFIGPDWLAKQGALKMFRRRIDNRNDFVRVEIETAFDRRKLVIPVLVRGARMPSAKELPTSLRDLSSRQAVEVDLGEQSHHRLADKIEEVLRFQRQGILDRQSNKRYVPEASRSVNARDANVGQQGQSSDTNRGWSPPLAIKTSLEQVTIALADVCKGRRANFRSRATSRTKQIVHLHDGESLSLDFETVERAAYEIYVRFSNDCLEGNASIEMSIDESGVGRIAATNTRQLYGQPGSGWDEFVTCGPLGLVNLRPGRHTLSLSVNASSFGIELDSIILKAIL